MGSGGQEEPRDEVADCRRPQSTAKQEKAPIFVGGGGRILREMASVSWVCVEEEAQVNRQSCSRRVRAQIRPLHDGGRSLRAKRQPSTPRV